MRGWTTSRHRVAMPVLLAAVLALAGCGGPGETPVTSTAEGAASEEGALAPSDGGGEGAGGSGGDATGTDGAEGGGAGQPDGGAQEAERLSWVPFGPTDPDVPTPSWPAYNAFASGDCAAVERVTAEQGLGEFGAAMVAVCRAAVEGQQDQWEEVAAFAGADPSVLANDCLAPLVSDLLQRALDWHARHPGQTPDVELVQVAGQTECGAQSAAANGTDGGATGDPDGGTGGEPADGATDGSGDGTTDGSGDGDTGEPGSGATDQPGDGAARTGSDATEAPEVSAVPGRSLLPSA